MVFNREYVIELRILSKVCFSMKTNENILTEIKINDEERARLTDRALILLTLKVTEKQNLQYLT